MKLLSVILTTLCTIRLVLAISSFTDFSHPPDPITPKSSARVDAVLRGGGSTFAYPAFLSWMSAYYAFRARFAIVRMTYEAQGSAWGKQAVMGNLEADVELEYAVSDSLLTEEDYVMQPDIQMIPCVAGALVMGYNLPGVDDLVLTREQLVGIYNGTYSWWNDTTFTIHNPNVSFPDARILPVAHLDPLGTTEAFTEALSAFSPAWKERFGAFSSPERWNNSAVKLFGQKVVGLAHVILIHTYSVGYLPLQNTLEENLPFAKLVNRDGKTVEASLDSIRAAVNSHRVSLTERLTDTLADSYGPDSYPLVGYSYILVRKQTMDDCDAAVELVRFIEWIESSNEARTTAEHALMVPAGQKVINNVSKVLSQMTCDSKKLNVMMLVEQQKYEEAESLKTWKVPVIVITPMIVIVVGVLIAFSLRQKVRYMRLLNRDDWKIDFFQLETFVPKGRYLHIYDPFGVLENAEDVGQLSLFHGIYMSHKVTLTSLSKINVTTVDRKTSKKLMHFRETIIHENVVRFFGLSQSNRSAFIVRDYCEKGRLNLLLKEDRFKEDVSLSYAIAADVASGMNFLHRQNIVHGRLNTSCCLVDSRWSVKISDWEHSAFEGTTSKLSFSILEKKKTECSPSQCDLLDAYRRLWTPPEIIKSQCKCTPVRSGDVYCFGLVMYEIFTGNDPCIQYLQNVTSPSKVMTSAVAVCEVLPFSEEFSTKPRQIIESAASSLSIYRPGFEQIVRMIETARGCVGGNRKSVINNIVESMDSYIRDLEEKLKKNKQELASAADTVLEMSGNAASAENAAKSNSKQL